MKHNTILFIFLLSFVFLSAGCDKFKGDTGPAGPSLSGDLIGYAYLYNVNGTRATDHSSITITVEGKNIVATTASDGRFVLSGLSTGTYTISFAKTGYGTRKSVGIQYVGGGQAYWGSTSLYQIPPFTVTNISATTSFSGYIDLNGSLSGALPTNTRYVRFFIGTSSSVSSDPQNNIHTWLTSVSSTSTTISTGISTQSLKSSGIISTGQTIYIVGYAESYSSGLYIDLATGRFYYPNLNPTPSNVVSVVVP